MGFDEYYRKLIFQFIIGFGIAIGTFTISIVAILDFTDLDINYVLLLSALISMIFSAMHGLWLRRLISSPMKALIDTIKIAGGDTSTPPPDLNNVKLCKTTVQSAAKVVNDMVSANAETSQKIATEHDYMVSLLNESPLATIVIDREKKIRYYNNCR
jgi:nitrogen fixation/metabolism regulation signal transduction histidine kinase